MRKPLFILIWIICLQHSLVLAGVIEGVVYNGTQGQPAGGGLEVALRVPFDGKFVVAAETTTGEDGSFRFADLPLDLEGPYLPGANLAGVHFPGPRVHLDSDTPAAQIDLTVYEPTTSPSPLITEQHTVCVQTEAGQLIVRESLLVSNPSQRCYVGSPRHEGGGPVTLELKIPDDFQQITFDLEGFGRRFQIINGKLVTGIPWPPGQKELAFQYVIGNQQTERVWRRMLDLPTKSLQLEVQGAHLEHLRANLPDRRDIDATTVLFEAGEGELPAGHLIEIQFDGLQVPLISRLRWVALFSLFALSITVGMTTLWTRKSRRESHRINPKDR